MGDPWTYRRGLHDRDVDAVDQHNSLTHELKNMIKNMDYEHEEIIKLNRIIKHDFLSVHFFYNSTLVELRRMIDHGLSDVEKIKEFLNKLKSGFYRHARGINVQLQGKAPKVHKEISKLVSSVVKLNHKQTKNELEINMLSLHELQLLKELEKKMGLLEMFLDSPDMGGNFPSLDKMYVALARGNKDLFLKFLDQAIAMSKNIIDSLRKDVKGLNELEHDMIKELKSIRIS